MANLSGLICGQSDHILTITGRKQGNYLFPGIYKHFDSFGRNIWSSDLIRAEVFAQIATGFMGDDFVRKDARLREIDFGEVISRII